MSDPDTIVADRIINKHKRQQVSTVPMETASTKSSNSPVKEDSRLLNSRSEVLPVERNVLSAPISEKTKTAEVPPRQQTPTESFLPPKPVESAKERSAAEIHYHYHYYGGGVVPKDPHRMDIMAEVNPKLPVSAETKEAKNLKDQSEQTELTEGAKGVGKELTSELPPDPATDSPQKKPKNKGSKKSYMDEMSDPDTDPEEILNTYLQTVRKKKSSKTTDTKKKWQIKMMSIDYLFVINASDDPTVHCSLSTAIKQFTSVLSCLNQSLKFFKSLCNLGIRQSFSQ